MGWMMADGGWFGWSFERVGLLFTGIAFLFLWIQVALLHWNGAYHRWQMWVPVGFGPILGLVGIGAAIYLYAPAVYVLFGLGAVVGLVGLYYHFRAIGYYITGYSLRNFIAGPPPVLPMMFTALSVLGLLATYWAVR